MTILNVLGKNRYVDYGIKLRETIFLAEDKSKNCVNYPHGKYETYSDCDDAFIASALPPGLVPIWSTDNIHKVTNKIYIQDIMSDSPYSYISLAYGNQKSTCPMSCSTINVEFKLLHEGTTGEQPGLGLIFSEDVLVTRTEFLTFNFMLFLSDIGGSMGLWLGVGLLQAVEIIIGSFLRGARHE